MPEPESEITKHVKGITINAEIWDAAADEADRLDMEIPDMIADALAEWTDARREEYQPEPPGPPPPCYS